MKVTELMTRDLYLLKETDTLQDAAKLFVTHRIDGAPLVDGDGQMVSIVTKTDVMRGIAECKDFNEILGSLPRKPIKTILPETDVLEALMMEVGRLPVADASGLLLGMLTRTDLCNGYKRIIEHMSSAREASKRLDAVIESSYDGIYITDGQAKTLLINKSYETITGLNRSDMVDHNMAELVDKGLISKSATLMVLKSRGPVTIEQEFPTGKKALVTSTPIFDTDGSISMVVTNVRDITSLVKLQNQLAQNQDLAQKYYSEIEEMRLQMLNTGEMIANDERMLETLRVAKRVAKVDATVLILGETGVGKEEVARFIHKKSERADRVFIKLNCGAIPANLIESELFGYERGAFTGANREGKLGLFEVADGGTLFLDEVGELPLDMQVRLLRVLQEKEVMRIGGRQPIAVDVRILAATNRDLEQMVRDKLFREDLFYRLNVIPIKILPLRNRREDILPMILHYTAEVNTKYGWKKSFSKEALKWLYDYRWPGNVRELKNLVERVIIMCDASEIPVLELGGITNSDKASGQGTGSVALAPLKDAVRHLEAEMIESAYSQYGNVRAAAKALGIDASTLVRKRQSAQRG